MILGPPELDSRRNTMDAVFIKRRFLLLGYIHTAPSSASGAVTLSPLHRFFFLGVARNSPNSEKRSSCSLRLEFATSTSEPLVSAGSSASNLSCARDTSSKF